MVTNKVKVALTPLGDRIKFRIFGRIYCKKLNMELPNSQTHSKNFGIWYDVFGSKKNTQKFLKRNKVQNLILNPKKLGYDDCDSTNVGTLNN